MAKIQKCSHCGKERTFYPGHMWLGFDDDKQHHHSQSVLRDEAVYAICPLCADDLQRQYDKLLSKFLRTPTTWRFE